MNILFLSRWFPYPPDNGSKIRIYNLLRGLATQHQITLISFYEPGKRMLDTKPLHDYCKAVYPIPWQSFRPDSWQALVGYFRIKPRSFIDTFSSEFKQIIEMNVTREHFDVVIASQIDTAVYIPYFSTVPSIFEEVEVGVLYEQYAHAHSIPRRIRYGLTWWKYRGFLASVLQRYNVSTVVSGREAELLMDNVSASTRVEIIPNCVDLQSYPLDKENPEPFTMIFTGAFTYEPNYEAMHWFVKYAYPAILAQTPQAHLTITGNHAGLSLPSANHITLTGFVEDVRPLIGRAWCSIIPLQKGGGTRLKILESMALGTPVVATSKGAEGLEVTPGEELLIADDPHSFAQAILDLFSSRELRQRLARNAYEMVRARYDWSFVLPKFVEIVEGVGKVN